MNLQKSLAQIHFQQKIQFHVKADIEFQSLNERFEHERFEILDTVSMPGIIGTLIDADGNSNNHIGEVSEENTLTTKWRNYNNHRFLGIPLSLGYEKALNKWFLLIEAQTLLNFHRRYSGKQLDWSGQTIDVSSTLDETFKIGYGLSIGVRYSISLSTSVSLRPHYFWYKNSVQRQMANYSQRYDMFGLQAELSYKLF